MPATSISRSERLTKLEESFVRACLDGAHPAHGLAARYLSAARLRKLLAAVQQAEGARADVTQQQLLQAVLSAGFVEVVAASETGLGVYWLKVRGGHRTRHNPLEVLAAEHEWAVISHHTCLLYHNLTTVRPRAHWVSTPLTAHTFGDLDGLPLRAVSVNERMRFGLETVWTDADEQVHVYDLERVLLATLDTPESHGGPRAVLEAWEAAADQLDEGQLIAHLGAWNSAIVWRRVGLLAERLGLQTTAERCRTARAGMTEAQMAASALIRGDSVLGHDPSWNLATPWAAAGGFRG